MQENNFEKQVRQKMDGLKINPSEELWQKVAGGIKKDKHNRWLLAILLLLLISGATGIMIMTKQPFGREENKIAGQQTGNKMNAVNQSNSTNQNVQIPATENNQPVVGAGEIQNATAKVLQGQQHVNAGEANKKGNAGRKFKQGLQEIAGIENAAIAIEHNTSSTDLQNKKRNKQYSTKQQLKTIIGNGELADEAIETPKQKDTDVAKSDKVIRDEKNEAIAQDIDTIIVQVATLKELPKDTLIKDFSEELKTTPVSKKKQKQTTPWKIGVNFSVGTSASQSGVLGIVGIGNGNMDKAFADALQNSSGSGTGSGSGSITSFTPSKLKAGLGFVAGAFVQKQISRKTNLLIGLNFKRYTSSMMIGSRVDSAANFSSNFYNLSRAYYRVGAQQVYKNHFNFIELPLAFRIKLGKQHKLPVYLNTGVSIARLIGSNALQFDVATGAYYSNNSFFNKTHVDMSAGVMFALFARAKNPLMAGPVLNFSLNKMADYGLYKNLHYSYLGLSVQKTLGKK